MPARNDVPDDKNRAESVLEEEQSMLNNAPDLPRDRPENLDSDDGRAEAWEIFETEHLKPRFDALRDAERGEPEAN